MFVRTINKNAICLILVLLTISLASLGVRLPWATGISSSSGKPKPRPRAIIENQIKNCKQIIKSLPASIAVLEKELAIVLTVNLISWIVFCCVSVPVTNLPVRSSRAPPFID